MPLTINSFKGDYAFLSNFFPAPTIHDGILYNCSEGAYQAAKSTDLMQRIQFVRLNGSQAKKVGKVVKLRADWNEVRVSIMREIVINKFQNNTALRERLVATGDAVLVEGNYWHDTFWGVCNGVGTNHLGIILMEVREMLK